MNSCHKAVLELTILLPQSPQGLIACVCRYIHRMETLKEDTYRCTELLRASLKTYERGWGRSKGELDALRGHGFCALTYPALLLSETLQLLLLGAQLLFQLPTAGLEPLCVLSSQQRRQWVLHPAHLAFSLGRTHVNTLISWASWATNPFSL